MRPRKTVPWIGCVMFGVMGLWLQVACGGNPPPVSPETSPPPPAAANNTPPLSPSAPPPPPPPPPLLPTELTPDEEFASRSLEALNRESPLAPAFYALDSFELDDQARRVLEANAEVLRQYPSWVVTIEGHCDERGTAEYNLGLSERRALAAREYLVELGLEPSSLRTVSYGKEFPFDPGHDETAWAVNRRAHFLITAN